VRAVNLIPSEQRTGASVGAGRSQGVAYAVLGLVGGLAVMAVLYGMARKQVNTRTGEAAALSAQVAQAQGAAAKLAPYAGFVSLQEQRVSQVTQIIDSRFDWAHVFHEFGRVMPADVSITALSGTVGSATSSSSSSAAASAAASSSGSTPPGSIPTFNISGCAVSQSAVALMLQRLRLIDGVKEVNLQSSTATAGSTSSQGGCPAGGPVFAVVLTFEPLPAATAATGAAADTVVSGPAPAAAPRTSEASAR